jgi:hypothetical protein
VSTRSTTAANVALCVAILLVIVVGVIALWKIDTWGEGGRQRREGPGGLEFEPIDPALIAYRQTAEIDVSMQQPRALAVGPNDTIYVGGDQAVHAFDADGTPRERTSLSAPPRCLAVGGPGDAAPGRLYAGMQDHVVTLDTPAASPAAWPSLGPQATLTSIAATDRGVFVADAGNRIVLQFSPSGELQQRIGAPDTGRNIPGFVITSEHFDLAMGADDLLYVVNPRYLRLESYAANGDLRQHWGEAAAGVEGFFGCCNPIHIAVLPDGRFVTAEKGIARIKVYSPEGAFESVVAGPEQMAAEAADLAVDSRGRVLVLDPTERCVRVFEQKSDAAGGGS